LVLEAQRLAALPPAKTGMAHSWGLLWLPAEEAADSDTVLVWLVVLVAVVQAQMSP
jgi:hypothetical protein